MTLPRFIRGLVQEMLGASGVLEKVPGMLDSDQWELTREYIVFPPTGFREVFDPPLSDATWTILGLSQ